MLLNAALCASSILFWLSIVKELELLQAEGFWVKDFLQLAWYIASLLYKLTSFVLVTNSEFLFFMAISWIVLPTPDSRYESPYVVQKPNTLTFILSILLENIQFLLKSTPSHHLLAAVADLLFIPDEDVHSICSSLSKFSAKCW